MEKFNFFNYFRKLPYKVRTSYLNKISMFFNLVWAVLKLFFAYYISSIFISLSGFYTIFIGLAKVAYFDGQRNVKKLHDEYKYYKRIAFSICLAGIVYLFYFIAFFMNPKDATYPLFVSISIAGAAFAEIFFSAWGLIKSKKTNDLLLSGLKFINLASAFSSLVLAQIALLSINLTVNESNIYNMITGTIVGLLTIGISIYMLLSLHIRFRKIYHALKVNKLYKINQINIKFSGNQKQICKGEI